MEMSEQQSQHETEKPKEKRVCRKRKIDETKADEVEGGSKKRKSGELEGDLNQLSTEDDEFFNKAFETFVVPIEKLADKGISAAHISKLRNAGYQTVGALNNAAKKDLLTIKGIGEATVDKVSSVVRTICPLKVESALDLYRHRQSILKVTIGSKNVDNLLDGGIESGSLTEIIGEFRTGKSQMCHHLCVTCQLPTTSGGLDGGAYFIDTEGTFRPERLIPIAERYGLNPEDVFKKVYRVRVFNTDQQTEAIKSAIDAVMTKNVKLLIIDSFTNNYRSDFSGRGELAARQMHMNAQLHSLVKIAEEHAVAVIITNQVMAVPDSTPYGPQSRPVGGHIMAHASTTRLYLRKGKGEERICKIYDSPCLPEAEATFSISNEGIIDPKD